MKNPSQIGYIDVGDERSESSWSYQHHCHRQIKIWNVISSNCDTFFLHLLKLKKTNLNHRWVKLWCRPNLEFLILDQVFSFSSSFRSGSFAFFSADKNEKEISKMNSNMKYLSNSIFISTSFNWCVSGLCPIRAKSLPKFRKTEA